MIVLIYGQREEPTGFETPLVCASHALGFRRALHCIYHTRFTIKERHTLSPNELLLYMVKTAGPMALGSLLASRSVSISVHT